MPTLPARLIVTPCLASLVACTTVRPVTESSGAPLSSQQLSTSIKQGDKLTITRTDGSVQQMVLASVQPDALEGTLAGSSTLTRIQIDQVRKIERRDVDGVKTSMLGLGIVLVFAVAIHSLITGLY